MVTSQTVLPPDQPAIVYVNLITSCGGAIIKECHPNFPIAGFLTMEEKCCALVQAITGDAACQAAGYAVTINDCLNSRTFKVTDQCAGGVLSLGISNDPNIFNQNTGGPIPDYEMEIITPSCSDPDGTAGNGNDNTGQVTLGGTSTGTPIHPGEGPHVEMDVTNATPGGAVAHAEVQTPPGMPSSAITEQLAQQLRAQGVQAQVVNGRQIRVKPRESPSLVLGPPIGIGIGTSDTGITTDTQVAPANLLRSVVVPPIPALSRWGLILAMALVVGAGIGWMILRK